MSNRFDIKKDVRLRIDGANLCIEYDKMFAKKINSRNFPALINKNEWTSAGAELLGLLNLLEKDDEFDNFYTLRGDIAERFVAQVLNGLFDKQYNANDYRTNVILFGDKEFTYGDQFYYDKESGKGNKDFGGRMDIAVKVFNKHTGDLHKAYIFEVKSKTHTSYEVVEKINEFTGELVKEKVVRKSDYKTIAIDKQHPQSEVWQGIFLAQMGTLSEINMVWVFFNEEQENELRKHVESYMASGKKVIPKLSFDFRDVKYHFNTEEFDKKIVEQDMKVARSIVLLSAKDKKIPLHFFNKYDLKIINEHITKQEKEDLEKARYEKRLKEELEENKRDKENLFW